MSVSFYRKKKRVGKCLAAMGYGKFNFIRAILQSCYDPKFGLGYVAWADLKWTDANPPFPDAMLDLFTQCDCEGELTNDEVKAIVKELEGNETFMQRKPFPELTRPAKYDPQGVWNNNWMNDPEWRDAAQKFFEMLKDCEKRGCGIEWF